MYYGTRVYITHIDTHTYSPNHHGLAATFQHWYSQSESFSAVVPALQFAAAVSAPTQWLLFLFPSVCNTQNGQYKSGLHQGTQGVTITRFHDRSAGYWLFQPCMLGDSQFPKEKLVGYMFAVHACMHMCVCMCMYVCLYLTFQILCAAPCSAAAAY